MVTYERDDVVAVVTVDGPDVRNAIDRATSSDLSDAVDRFETDEHAHAMVHTGTEGTFSARTDLDSMDLATRDNGWFEMSRRTVSKPTIRAVESYCVACGLELAL